MSLAVMMVITILFAAGAIMLTTLCGA